MKKYLRFTVFILLFLCLPVVAKANIEITSFESSIKLNKNNTADINESYNLYYIDNTKTFVRGLDTAIEIIRPKDSKSIIKPKVDSINTSNEYEISNSDKQKKINITKKGIQDTTGELNLSYKYDFGRDISKKYDEFYYNIISNFEYVVSDVSFEIELPDSTNIKNINFILNGDILDEDSVTYVVENNILTGYLNQMLNENDRFAVRFELPQGYFENTSDNFNYLSYLFLLIPILSLIYVTIYWFKFGIGNKVKKKYDFYPPNNFDPAEIGYIYKGKMEEADLTALLLHLANKGYLSIEENDDGYKLGKENTFNFIKLKEYDGRNAAEKILFNGIFKDRDKATLSDIEYTIKNKLMDAKSLLENRRNIKRFFNIEINKTKMISLILIALSVISLTIKPVKEFTGSYLLVPVLVATMLFGLAVLVLIDTKVVAKIILSLIFVGGTIFLNAYSLYGQNQLLLIYIIGIVLVLISTFIYSKLPMRTKFGNAKLGEVEGFRINLVTLNQNKLKELMSENPNYYYDMLPYANVFGIIDNWQSLGNKIIEDRPSWHISNEKYELKKEIKFFKNVIFTTTQVLIKGLYNQKESSQVEFKSDIDVKRVKDN